MTRMARGVARRRDGRRAARRGARRPRVREHRRGVDPERVRWLSGRGHYLHRGSHGEADVNVCSVAVAPGVAHCDAHVRTDLLRQGRRPLRACPGSGGRRSTRRSLGNDGAYDPAYLQSAYNAPSATDGTGPDGRDRRRVRRAQHRERPRARTARCSDCRACTTANGCFTKVDQSGGTNYPAANSGWAQEISLDVQMVSAICPNCHILLVEATTASSSDLGAAVERGGRARRQRREQQLRRDEWSERDAADAAYFDHPGVAIVASTGDSGYGVSYPAASPDVVAVGGTSLVQATNDGHPQRDRDRVVGRRQRLQRLRAEARVADRHRLRAPNGGRRLGGRRSEHGRLGLRQRRRRMGSVRRDECRRRRSSARCTRSPATRPSTDELGSYPYAARPGALNDVVSGSNGSCGAAYLCTGSVWLRRPDRPRHAQLGRLRRIRRRRQPDASASASAPGARLLGRGVDGGGDESGLDGNGPGDDLTAERASAEPCSSARP